MCMCVCRFPLEKAERYVALRRPFMVNDVTSQHVLLDRRSVYKVLRRSGVPVPPHIIVNREPPEYCDPPGFVEEEDSVEIEGARRITKPFVEKPISGEDHHINIYYPGTVGGGVKKLFRYGDASLNICGRDLSIHASWISASTSFDVHGSAY